jgi:hypothetical protein
MNIDDYYRQTRDLNISETGGWAPAYYGVFSKVIEENNYKNIAEIGAGYGTHSRYILLNNPSIDKLTIIDPMKFYPNDPFANDINSCIPVNEKNNFDRLYELINEDLAKISNKYRWIHKQSDEVTDEEIPNESLDALFIDGNHAYDFVLNDLKKYWNKVRSGGQILGDDYWMEGVARAVNDFSNIIGVKYDFLYRPNTDYKIYRFIKP